MPVRKRNWTKFAREFNPEYHSPANRAARSAFKRSWFRLAGRAAAGIGGLAVAGLANLFTRVPKLDTRPDMPRLPYRARAPPLAGERPLKKKAKTSVDPSGSYVQLRRERATSGKEIGTVDALSKLLHAHCNPRIDRFQNVTNINNGAGAYPLTYVGNATVRAFPYYMFDLTSIGNRIGPTTDYADPYPFMRLLREVTSGRYYWGTEQGRTHTDAVSPVWQLERYSNQTTTRAEERSFLEWFDIKMVLYGARACPMKIDVGVVQFTDEEMVPRCVGTIGASADQNIEPDTSNYPNLVPPVTGPYNRWQMGWQGVTDSLVGSTISQRNLSEVSNFMKYKFRKIFTFNPTGAEETDATGHQVEFRFKYLMNKVCDYVTNPTDWVDVATTDEGNPNIWPVFEVHKLSAVPPPKGREFLVIKAFTPDYNPEDPNAKAGSFDLMVRRKKTMIRT